MADPIAAAADDDLAPLSLRVAIADPGSLTQRRAGETVPSWSARAVLLSKWLAAHDAAVKAEAWDEGRLSTGVLAKVEAERDMFRDKAHRAIKALGSYDKMLGRVQALAVKAEEQSSPTVGVADLLAILDGGEGS